MMIRCLCQQSCIKGIGTYDIKMSATMFIPRNIHESVKQYIIASRTGFNVEIPGKRAQLKIKVYVRHEELNIKNKSINK